MFLTKNFPCRPKRTIESTLGSNTGDLVPFVAAVFVTVINSVPTCWLSLRNCTVGLLLRCGLGDVAMVGDVSYRVNYKEGPNQAKWSPIRPWVRRTERLFGSGIVCRD